MFLLKTFAVIAVDVNECLDNTTCAHGCVNTDGSYNCTCRTGYELSGDQTNCQSRYMVLCRTLIAVFKVGIVERSGNRPSFNHATLWLYNYNVDLKTHMHTQHTVTHTHHAHTCEHVRTHTHTIITHARTLRWFYKIKIWTF